MRLDYPNDHIDPVETTLPGLGEHFIGLADAGGGPHEYLQAAVALFVGLLQKRFRRRALVGCIVTHRPES